MKRVSLLFLLLAGLIAAALTACGPQPTEENTIPPTTSQTTAPTTTQVTTTQPTTTPPATTTQPTTTPPDTREVGPQAGKVAPAFSLQSLDGYSVSLASLRGQPVILNFWATW
jgi:cytochrome oxidase Cu insertion factor (SCO1/SenC/PrrC family)